MKMGNKDKIKMMGNDEKMNQLMETVIELVEKDNIERLKRRKINYYEEFEKLGVEHFNNNIDKYRKDGYFIPNSWKFHKSLFHDLKNSGYGDELSQSEIEEEILNYLFNDSDSSVSDNHGETVYIDSRIKEWGYKYFPREYMNGGYPYGVSYSKMNQWIRNYENKLNKEK